MPVAIKSEPVLLVAGGSHWLELETGPPRRYADGRVEPFAREELFPILEVEAPRVGTVRARFSVDRYVSSNYDEKTGASFALWGDWRIVLRDVRLPQTLVPENVHGGPHAAGIGDATRRAIVEACSPVIRSWLAGAEYPAARRAAAAFAVKRLLDAPADYRLRNVRDTLETVKHELDGIDAARLLDVLSLLDEVAATLGTVPVNPNDYPHD